MNINSCKPRQRTGSAKPVHLARTGAMSGMSMEQSSCTWTVSTIIKEPVDVSEAGGTAADVSSYSDVDSSADSTRYTKLSVYYSNCRSVLPKMDDLRVLAEVDKPDTIALCETWLGKEVCPSEVTLPEFRSYWLDCTRHGGGVLLYIHECLGPVRCIFDNDNAEFISAVVSTAAGPVWIGCTSDQLPVRTH